MRAESAVGASKYSPSAKEASDVQGIIECGGAESSMTFSAHLEVEPAGMKGTPDGQTNEDSGEESERDLAILPAPQEPSAILLVSTVPFLPQPPVPGGAMPLLDDPKGDIPLIQSSLQITLQNTDVSASGESIQRVSEAAPSASKFPTLEDESMSAEASPLAIAEEGTKVVDGTQNSVGSNERRITETQSEQVAPVPVQIGTKQPANVAGEPVTAVPEGLVHSGSLPPRPDKYRERGAVIGRGTASANALPGMTPELKSSSPNLTNMVTDDSNDRLEPGTRFSETGVIISEEALTNSTKKDVNSVDRPAEGDQRRVFTVHSTGFQHAVTSETVAQGSATPSPTRFDSVFRALGEVAEKMRREGPGRVEVELQLDSGETVRVRLELQQGAVKATFRTETGDLQQALQHGWANFSQQKSERGFVMADASFEANSQNPQAALNQDSRQNHSKDRQGHQGPIDQHPHTRQVSRGSGGSVLQAESGSLSLWA